MPSGPLRTIVAATALILAVLLLPKSSIGAALPPTPAPPMRITSEALSPDACDPDAFEPDDLPTQASNLPTTGQPAQHTFHVPSDIDWMAIETARAGLVYNIRTSDLVTGTDTFIFLYDHNNIEVKRNDDIDSTKCQAGLLQYCASTITWTATYGGPYYALILNLGRGGVCPAYKVRATQVGSWIPLAARDLLPPATWTPTATSTHTATPTPSATPTSTPTGTATATPTSTQTQTPTTTPTPSNTPTQTATSTTTLTPSITPTSSATPTASQTPTPSTTPTASQTPTASPTSTVGPSPTPTATPTYPLVIALPAGVVPNGLAVDPATGRIYVTGRDNAYVYAIDGTTHAVVNSQPVGSLPWGVAAWHGKIYVANFGDHNIQVLDATALTPQKTIAVRGYPTFVKVNATSDRVIAVTYSGAFDDNRVVVIDPSSDTVVADVPAGGGGAWGLAINPNLNRVYVSTRDSGSIVTLDGNSGYAKIDGQIIPHPCGETTGASPYSMDFDTALNRLYLACARYDNVDRAVIYTAGAGGLVREAILPVGNGGADGGGGIVANSASGHAFFTNSLDNTVSVVSGISLTVIDTIPVGLNPFGAALNPVTQQVFVGNRGSSDVWVLLDAYP